MDPQAAYREFPASQPRAAAKIEAVPEGGHEEEGSGHPQSVNREQYRSTEDLPGGGRDGEHRAKDGAGTEASEPVDGPQSEGGPGGLSPDLTPHPGEGTQ